MQHDLNDYSYWLAYANNLACQCPPMKDRFNVGAVLISPDGTLIADGYTREHAQDHAEEICIQKALDKDANLKDSIIFSTLEPCSIRLSGKKTCSSRILEAGIKTVVYALKEPDWLVDCEGHEKLTIEGVRVIQHTALNEAIAPTCFAGFDQYNAAAR